LQKSSSCRIQKMMKWHNKPVNLTPKAEPFYYILGQTDAGRYLFCVVIQFPDGRGYPVTARPMTDKEKLRYKEWRER